MLVVEVIEQANVKTVLRQMENHGVMVNVHGKKINVSELNDQNLISKLLQFYFSNWKTSKRSIFLETQG